MSRSVVLVTPPTVSHRTAEETLALGYLAAVLRGAGYTVSVIDCWLEGLTLGQMIDRLKPLAVEVIGVSCYRSNLDQAEEMIAAVRAQFGDIPAFCGGYGPTFSAEDFLDAGFTVAAIGEAEATVVDLVGALLGSHSLDTVPNIAYRRDGQTVRTPHATLTAPLDEIPHPHRDTVAVTTASRNFVHLCTSRGCGAHCSFCSIFAFAAGVSPQSRWRARSLDDIVAEIEWLYQQFGVRHFKIVDDSFIEPPRDETWAERFRDEILGRDMNIRFRTQVRADRLTPGIVSALSEAGWFSTAVGIENASADALARMRKLATPEQNQYALDLLAEYGVFVQMGMIMFDPDTSMAELRENYEFLRANRWPFTKGVFTEMFAAEGTPFTKGLRHRGLAIVGSSQNYRYEVQNPSARRIHAMLKRWHTTHCTVYDWVIDSLTAPKVMTDAGFAVAHQLCQTLQALDLNFFVAALQRVEADHASNGDAAFTEGEIMRAAPTYGSVSEQILALYTQEGLQYDGAPNPFLDN